VLGTIYDMNKASFIFNKTYFSEVTWWHAMDISKDQTFAEKVIMDLRLAYKFTNTVSSNVLVNSLFDVYPDKIDIKGDVVIDLGCRFKYA
jgi:iron complex outermembrane receptor protein